MDIQLAKEKLSLSELEALLLNRASELSHHHVYSKLTSVAALRIFMSYHVYAVWDFMSLLKSLQREITCVSLPWRPSKYSKKLVRLINEIVLGEESDIGHDALPTDHFTMYLRAMNEVGLDTKKVLDRIETLDFKGLPPAVNTFVSYNLELATSAGPHEVCAAFFYGRENIIPDLFRPVLEVVSRELKGHDSFKYYLDRHIELDGDEHGPLAKRCLMEIVGDDTRKLQEAYLVGLQSLVLRENLWSAAAHAIDKNQTIIL